MRFASVNSAAADRMNTINTNTVVMVLLALAIVVFWRHVLLGVYEIALWWHGTRAAYWLYRLKIWRIHYFSRTSIKLQRLGMDLSFLSYRVRMWWYVKMVTNGFKAKCPTWHLAKSKPKNRG